MEKFIAVVFDTEEAAFKGADAMRDLHKNGELAVYAAGIVSKDEDGVVALRSSADEGPIGTAFGMMMGALVGLLAGPAAIASGAAVAGTAAAAQIAAGGMAFGGVTGGLFGAYRDLSVFGMDAAMLENVNTELLPGKSCVVASVDEVWTTPLDLRMKEAGGTVFRKLRVDAIDEQLEKELDELDHELAALDEEFRQAEDDAKAAIIGKIDAVKTRMQQTGETIDTRLDEMDEEFEARLVAIDQQIESAADATMAKFEKRKAEIQADRIERREKLAASLRKIADKVSPA